MVGGGGGEVIYAVHVLHIQNRVVKDKYIVITLMQRGLLVRMYNMVIRTQRKPTIASLQ